MGKSIVLALLAMLIIWFSAVAYASALMVWKNWPLFATWPKQDRETRARLWLWLAVLLTKIAILTFAGDAIWSIVAGNPVSSRAMIRGLIVLPFLLLSSVLMLRWIHDRRFGALQGDRRWRRLMWSGVALAAVVFGSSWWL